MGFVGKSIAPEGALDVVSLAQGEPSLPAAFTCDGDRLEVREVRKTWRSTKDDRGDTYVKKHWFEFETTDGRIAVVYFDRSAQRKQPRWWLYTLTK